jgi:hypothetical protein
MTANFTSVSCLGASYREGLNKMMTRHVHNMTFAVKFLTESSRKVDMKPVETGG